MVNVDSEYLSPIEHYQSSPPLSPGGCLQQKYFFMKVTLPPVLLRVEGATLLILSVLLYGLNNGGGWLLFALLFLVPDLSMLGYLVGRQMGAVSYNLFHTYALPGLLAGFGLVAGEPLVVSVALVWLAHIGFDRMVGYGLKYPTGFFDTHLHRL
jgi:Domain of unknown function (DUF4260)